MCELLKLASDCGRNIRGRCECLVFVGGACCCAVAAGCWVVVVVGCVVGVLEATRCSLAALRSRMLMLVPLPIGGCRGCLRVGGGSPLCWRFASVCACICCRGFSAIADDGAAVAAAAVCCCSCQTLLAVSLVESGE